jgi:hypothetical protein
MALCERPSDVSEDANEYDDWSAMRQCWAYRNLRNSYLFK